jgi:hypothetical protein
MRVAVIVVCALMLATPSEASKSCMSKTEARQHFGPVQIYWLGKDHCWDATATPRQRRIHKVQQLHVPKWHEAMSEMLPDEEPVQTPWVDRWVDIEPPQPPIVARCVDIVRVAPSPITERKPEPTVTSRGVVMVIISIALTLAIVEVLFGGMIYQRLASERNTRSAVFWKKMLFRNCAVF